VSYCGLMCYETMLSVIRLGDDDAMQIFRAAGVGRAKDWL
jgi:hypothetical protein